MSHTSRTNQRNADKQRDFTHVRELLPNLLDEIFAEHEKARETRFANRRAMRRRAADTDSVAS